MANFYVDVSTISRGKGRSVTKLANYISGQKLHDCYLGKTYYKKRSDILFCDILLPDQAPSEFSDLQYLCGKIEQAEKRYDARTAREIKASLPNELSLQENIRIVQEYIRINFLQRGLCAIAAIHEGRNAACPEKNNPHVHIIIPTRTVEPTGFCRKKLRELDKIENVTIWREQLANVLNLAYERNGLSVRVSHESLKVQGIYDREPVVHLSRIDWQKEQRGEHTPNGDKNRAIRQRNEERAYRLQQEVDRRMNIEPEII